jgi:hypothetical protein
MNKENSNTGIESLKNKGVDKLCQEVATSY